MEAFIHVLIVQNSLLCSFQLINLLLKIELEQALKPELENDNNFSININNKNNALLHSKILKQQK